MQNQIKEGQNITFHDKVKDGSETSCKLLSILDRSMTPITTVSEHLIICSVFNLTEDPKIPLDWNSPIGFLLPPEPFLILPQVVFII